MRRYWNGLHWTNRYRRNGSGGWMVAFGVLALVGVVLGGLTVAAWVLIFATASDPVSDADDIHQQLTEAGLQCSGWKVRYGAPSGYIGRAEWANGTCTFPSGATLEVSTFDDEVTLQNQINEPVPRHAADFDETGQEIGCPWLEGDRFAISAPFEQAAPSAEARAQAEQEMGLVFKTLPGTRHDC